MRALLTLLVLFVAVLFAASFFMRDKTPASQTETANTQTAEQNPAAPQNAQTQTPDTANSPATADAPQTAQDQPQTPAAQNQQAARPEATTFEPFEGLAARPAPLSEINTLGSTDEDEALLEVKLIRFGAAIAQVASSRYTQTATGDEPLIIQKATTQERDGKTIPLRYPFGSESVTINGTWINLLATPWENTGPGQYQLVIVDAQHQEVARITRRYSLGEGTTGYDIICKQSFENLSGRPIQLIWGQLGQVDLKYTPNYSGDKRQFIAGYYDLQRRDPWQVFTRDSTLARADLLSDDKASLWPNPYITTPSKLAWIASVNRYFATAIHRVPPPPVEGKRVNVPPLDEVIATQRVFYDGTYAKDKDESQAYLLLRSHPMEIAPQESKSLDLSFYVGPRDREVFRNYPYDALQFDSMVVYDMGCAFCTFQPLARFLLWFLRTIHWLVLDWGVAIIILVLCVRGVLHPITKKSQVNMMKMSKGMQALQPEIEKLKKKYADNPQKMQQEQMRLFREKGINPFNMLGCLPMFLQMPIWVALYAMLYFAVELYHQPAFYGIFQTITNGNWHFLADLSEPDRFIRFYDEAKMVNLIFLPVDYSSLNLLPLLMGVVFYFNQKLTMPPPANEQAAQQQKIMKFMTLLFPVFLYAAPSGLTLYILASTGAGIVDSYFVRKHIRQEEEAGTLFDKKPPKPGGFRDRMGKMLAEKQRRLEEMQQQKNRSGGGSGGTGGTHKRRKKR